MAEEQRDLLSTSDRGSAVLRGPEPSRSLFGRRAALSALSILVALLIVGQAVTVYFVYQQGGQIDKLTKTSQTLQLQALQNKMPSNAKPVSKMRMAMVNMPLAMRSAHPCLTLAAASCNKTEDQVKHLLLQADPQKMFPELKDNLLDNLKHLKKSMTDVDWKSFESWMHKWLLFELAKKPQKNERKVIPAQKGIADGTVEPEEMIFSGVDVLKLDGEKGEQLGTVETASPSGSPKARAGWLGGKPWVFGHMELQCRTCPMSLHQQW
uniref:CD74 molecule n=1 Tax=Nothoprocta perdicaria TaxID=30464 RepID=A0A8C6ZA01_NOTPE